MSTPGMALVEELDAEDNRVRRVMWICTRNHNGIIAMGYPIVCPQCCHDGDVPPGLECRTCGATHMQPTPVRQPRSHPLTGPTCTPSPWSGTSQ